MTKMHKNFPLIILLLIYFPLNAQQISGKFNSATISFENNEASPYAIKFVEGTGISKDSFWNEYKKFFGLSDDHEFNQYSELKDQLGQTHYRFNQYYKGIEVVEAQFILHEKRDLIYFANGHLVHNIETEVSPSLSEEAALQSALNKIGADSYMWQKNSNEEFIKREQNNPDATFYPEGELKLTTGTNRMIGENIKLVYRFDIYAEQPLGRYYVDVDARTGEIINVISRSYDGDVPGSGTTNYNGTVELVIDNFTGGYRLRESGRGSGIQTYDMHSSTNFVHATDFEDADTNFTDPNAIAGVSVHWAIEGAYDYFWFEHGRNSVDGNGFLLRSYVHFGGGWFNAQWDGSRMRFGDGNGLPLVSIDISAHEMTHGVTQFSANLIYQKESGALNESFSDIFGTSVEFYLEGPTADWLIAEDIGAFRSMENPNAYDDPDTYFGQHWASLGGSDFGGVHTNSGVQNFWYYLLTEGGSGVNDNGDTYSVTGIGLNDAAKIAYRNLTVYLTPASPYFDARFGALNSAIDLFGLGSQQYQSVIDAWYAVGVYQPYLEQRIGVSTDTLHFLAEVSFNQDTASIVVSNIGLLPLTVSNIQLSGTHFEIINSPSFPIDLNGYLDNFTLRVVFTPTAPGVVIETLDIISNDPVNPVKSVYFKGKGFTINPSLEKVLYACSGLGNNGRILTLNVSTGEGTILGSSRFDEIKSIAIDPVSDVIYGLTTSNVNSEILRVNSTEGDAYLLYTINLPLMAGFAFDNTGTLYGSSIFGEIYRIDLSTGTYEFVVDANTSTTGFTFNPLNNELWATSRSFAGPNVDKIFRIDLLTGETTEVGHTGLGSMTNDIAFNENGELYGIIGGTSGNSDLININTSTGEGIIIGSIGYENILGLAYNPGDISSVNNGEQIPVEYGLRQNFPNPFNPATTIKYQLPECGMVSLKVFNMLGEEIATLVNQEIEAGVYNVNFDAAGLSSGVYFYTLKVDDGSKFLQTNKMVILK